MAELSAGAAGGMTTALRQIVHELPIPAIVLEAGSGSWRLQLANTVFTRTFGADSDPIGLPLADLVPEDRTAVIDGAPIPAVLEEVVRTVQARTTRVLLDAPADGAATRAGALRTRWTLRLQPLGEPVWGVLITFLDLSGQLLASAQPEETAALQDLAAGLTVTKSVPQVYADAVRGAALAAGARRGAILLSDGGATFHVAAATPDTDLPDPVVVDDLSSPVWQACLGRRRISWSAEPAAGGPERFEAAEDTRPPLPFAGQPGWEQLLVTGLRLHGRWQGVLVVGEPRLGGFDADALERLELVATLASTAVDNARLVDQFQRLEELLTAAVATSASLVEGTDPDLVRERLLHGLVDGMGLAGATLWVPSQMGDGSLVLVGSAGVPDEVRQRVAELSPTTMAAKLARGALSGRLRQAATAAATSSWPGHEVRLVHVPEPASGILGVYVSQPLPELVDGVLATLAHGLAAAEHQATLHERARTVVNSLQRELRPRNVVLPASVDVGHVYRSATVGVDVGGDFFDWFVTDNDHIGLACGDVSGKGVEAASLTAMAVYSLRAFALRGTTAQIVLTMLNGAVCDQTPEERFMTLAYARFDLSSWRFQLAVGGHPPPIIVGPAGARLVDAVPDIPVGIEPSATFEQLEFELAPGESLVMYTDGVTEARSAEGELFGSQHLLETLSDLARSPGHTAQRLADGVWEAVGEWTDDGTTDDVAIVVLRRAETASAP